LEDFGREESFLVIGDLCSSMIFWFHLTHGDGKKNLSICHTSYPTKMFNPCEVQRIMPLWKRFHALVTSKCPCDVILSDVVRGGQSSFSKCRVCLCVPYTILFVSFLVVQIIKHLHNTKYFWEAFHNCCPTFISILIFAMLNLKKILTTIF
jgi:hypothetical protein